MSKNRVVEILMTRDGLSRKQAEISVMNAQLDVRNGADPEDVLWEEFGLEADYIDDLI